VLVPFGPGALLNAAVPGAAYVAGVEHVRRTGRVWPARRTVALVAALLVLGAATSSAADGLVQASLAWHMTQQMALLFLVPLCLVAARPDELARPRSRWVPTAAALAAAWVLVAALQWIVHVPAVLDALARRPSALAAVHWALVAAGVAFFGCAGRARFHPLVVGLYVVSIMAGTDAIGLWLLFDPHVVYDHYAGSGALADQHRAGAVMFAAGMVPLLAGAGIAYRWLSPAESHR
jgi:cytochrome c oxidase assembly factor CtaG